MTIKQGIKHILYSYNPFAKKRRKSLRKALTNNVPSFLCPNCTDGILFHDLGLQFRFPTVNLMMFQRDFVKFVLHREEYLSVEFVPFSDPEYTCPYARLKDIHIHFTHYPDFPYTLHIPKYEKDGEVGNILRRSYWYDHREYETYFGFVKWFNEANGGNYDISIC